MSIVYSAYSLATNIIAAGIYKKLVESGDKIATARTYISYVALSLGSKQMNPTSQNEVFYYIQCWIGLAVVVIWLIMFFILKYSERKTEIEVEEETISAADFSITI